MRVLSLLRVYPHRRENTIHLKVTLFDIERNIVLVLVSLLHEHYCGVLRTDYEK